MTNKVSFTFSDMGGCDPVNVVAVCTPGTGVGANAFSASYQKAGNTHNVEVIIDNDINLEGKNLSCVIDIKSQDNLTTYVSQSFNLNIVYPCELATFTWENTDTTTLNYSINQPNKLQVNFGNFMANVGTGAGVDADTLSDC